MRVFFALALVGGLTLSAYNVKPYKWAVLSVPFLVNPATPDASPDAVESSVVAAAQAWHTQAGIQFQFVYAGRTTQTALANDRKNVVVFRPESNGSTVAVTYWWYDGTGHLIDADIKFWDEPRKFFAGTTGCSSGHYILDIATHEFGHALGMNHSTVANATMFATTTTCASKWRSLDPDDVAGVRTLYPALGLAPKPRPPGTIRIWTP